MEDYFTRRLELLNEISSSNQETKNKSLGESIRVHKEILSAKENFLNENISSSLANKLKDIEDATGDVEIKVHHKDVRCPLSQQKIIEPFESVCGHVFERKEVLNFLNFRRNSAVCPVMGCSKKIVQKDNK